MLTRDEIDRSISGAVRLLMNDRQGLAAFDTSIEGFFRSFAAGLIVYPGLLLSLYLQMRAIPPDAAAELSGEGFRLLAPTVAFAANWLTFPIVAAILAKILHRTEYYIPYVVANNWAAVVQTGIFVCALIFAQLLPPSILPLLLLMVTGGLLFYDFLIAKFAFNAPGFDGVAVVAVQLMAQLVVNRVLTGMLT